MPIYEYHCNGCNKNFEYLVLGRDETPDCPSCSGNDVRRQMSACGFVSKGSGGAPAKTAAGTSGCSGCSATSCGSCGV